jgi:hypothetical protein
LSLNLGYKLEGIYIRSPYALTGYDFFATERKIRQKEMGIEKDLIS